MIYVLYHRGCSDGFGAAYAAWKVLGDSAKYLPVMYGEPLPELEPESEIYIVDFSYSKDILLSLSLIHKRIVVLDHHKTAKDDLQDFPATNNVTIVFDMDKSGAVLAWDYFVKTEPTPLMKAIEDRDLWRFKLPMTKIIMSYLFNQKQDFAVWAAIDEKLASGNLDEIIRKGEAYTERDSSLVEMLVRQAYPVVFDGKNMMAVNTSVLVSELGNVVCEKYPDCFGSIIWSFGKKGYIYGLRSIGDKDVSAIALKFGGGGHKNAAGIRSKNFILEEKEKAQKPNWFQYIFLRAKNIFLK